MMPLALANIGEENMILKVGGDAETKRHLEDLGFVAGVIVKVKESRVAISEEMARKIMI